MKKLLILSFMLIAVGLSACTDGQTLTPTKFITNDSTLLFTFVKDSLYVDTYESGCGIEQYRLEEVSSNNNKTIYKAYLLSVLDENEKIELHSIIVSKNVLDAHWEYRIKFDDEDMIPIMKISP